MASEADRHLLALIGDGDAEGWRQFVNRFQKRLIAFARARVESYAAAEDLVQDAFVSFLTSHSSFERQSSLETFLFQILRRRIIDHYRKRGQSKEIPACSIEEQVGDSVLAQVEVNDGPEELACDRETDVTLHRQLESAIGSVTRRLREEERFRDLKIAEAIFYAGIKNRDLAKQMDCEAAEIALVKHRLLQLLAKHVESASEGGSELKFADQRPVNADLLTRVWERQRPSCPKRTTLGKHSLGLLPVDWADYVEFHWRELGCIYCAANMEEMIQRGPLSEVHDSSHRLFQSTIGFLTNAENRP